MDREIKRKLDKLAALEAAGVDNWDGYEDALKEWEEEWRHGKHVSKALLEIQSIMEECDIDYKSGVNCEPFVDYGKTDVEIVLWELVNAVLEK